MPSNSDKYQNSNITICLSGGGLRATFYHLGVIKALRELNYLKNVKQIYSVSGGSILAAHAAINWNKFIGTDEEFKSAFDELCRFGSRNIRARVVNRYLAGLPTRLFSWLPFINRIALLERFFGRSETLEKEYRKLVGNTNLGNLEGDTANTPAIYIMTTSFSVGSSYAFTHNGLISDLSNPVEKLNRTKNIPISQAIAASSAFPPLFPPVCISRESVNGNSFTLPSREVYLTDGGVFDNLGLDAAEMMLLSVERSSEQNTFLVSDASAPFATKEDADFSDLISRTVRTTDILMNRVTEASRRAKTTQQNDEIIHLNISEEIDGPITEFTPIDIQKNAAFIRTDLDNFSEFEQRILIQRGYEVCVNALSDNGPLKSDLSGVMDFTKPEHLSKAISNLKKSKSRSAFRPVVSDFYFWVLAAYLVIALGVFATPIYKLFIANQTIVALDNTIEDQKATIESSTDRQDGISDAFERQKTAKEIEEQSLSSIDQSYLIGFDQYLKSQNITFIEPARLITLGQANENLSSPAFGKNAYPPETAWQYIVPAARALNKLALELGGQPEVLSTYRTSAYNQLLGGAPNSQHLTNSAIDFKFDLGTPNDWAAKLREYRDEGLFLGGIGVSANHVQIDQRGYAADWVENQFYVRDSSVDLARVENIIYIQFAGYVREDIIEFATLLNSLGWNVPSFTRGGERTEAAIGKMELRYNPDTAEETVDALLKDLNKSVLDLELRKSPSEIIPAGILEIWISR